MAESKTKLEEIRKMGLKSQTSLSMAQWYYRFYRLLVSTRHENQCQDHPRQALTLAALAGAAVVEYYDHKTEANKRYPKFLPPRKI